MRVIILLIEFARWEIVLVACFLLGGDLLLECAIFLDGLGGQSGALFQELEDVDAHLVYNNTKAISLELENVRHLNKFKVIYTITIPTLYIRIDVPHKKERGSCKTAAQTKE